LLVIPDASCNAFLFPAFAACFPRRHYLSTFRSIRLECLFDDIMTFTTPQTTC